MKESEDGEMVWGGIRDRRWLFGSGKTHGKCQVVAAGIIGIVYEQGQEIIRYIIAGGEHLVVLSQLRKIGGFHTHQPQRAGLS